MTRFQSHSLANAGAIAALFALTVAAQAADLGQKPLPPSPPPLPLAPVSSWSGFYAGAAYGGGHAAAKSSQTGSSTASAWGQSAGAFVGYNFTYGPLVFGPEGDFDFHILRPVNNGGPGLGGSVNDTLETLRLRGRVGYAVGAFMPFVAAGVASAKMYEYSYPWPYLDQGQSHLATGLTLGAGLEYQFAVPYFGPVTVRGEYIYDSYPTQTFTIASGAIHVQTSEQFFRVGVVYYPDQNWHPQPSADFKPDWSGAYGGLLGGDLWSRQHTTLGGASTNFDANGGEVGIFTGRNFMFGPWMVGYEGAAMISNSTGKGPQPTVGQTSFDNYFESDLRLRAGYAFGRFLPYIAAGGDWGRSQQTDLTTGSFRGRVYTDSLTAGAGVEYALNERWAARAEYLFDSQVGSTNVQLDDIGLRQSRFAQQARVGVAYYFH